MFMILIKIIQGIQHLIFYTLNKILNIQHPIIYSHCVHSFKEFLELKWIKWYFNRRILVSWSDTDTVDLILTTGFFFDFILTTGFSFDLILTTVFHLISFLPQFFIWSYPYHCFFHLIAFLLQVFIQSHSYHRFFHFISLLPQVFFIWLNSYQRFFISFLPQVFHLISFLPQVLFISFLPQVFIPHSYNRFFYLIITTDFFLSFLPYFFSFEIILTIGFFFHFILFLPQIFHLNSFLP